MKTTVGPIAVAVFLATIVIYLSDLLAQPALTASDEVSRTGYFQLSWQSGLVGEFILEQDTTSQFDTAITIYRGTDTARTISGLLNGKYSYRVRSVDGDWSKPVMVTVEHYELGTAFLFLGLGAIVFLATATLIVRGHIAHRKYS
ncbi:hypothetical protein MJD09_27120 [bacterium]|nr:hypothetical protein [bacterium]